jgi:hypothetical protein
MKRSIRKQLFVLVLTFLLAFGMTTPAAAQSLVTGDSVPAGTVLDHDAILIGQNVIIDGTVNGNVFILGNQVTINGTVDGSVILIGQNAEIAGMVSGGVYGTALTFDLGPGASIGRDLYVVTVSLTSGIQSLIGRDLYAIGLDSGLNGKVGRDLHTAIGPIQLYNGLMTMLGYNDLTIKLHFEAPQPAPVPTSSPTGVQPSHIKLARMQVTTPAAEPGFDWGNWAIILLRNWAVLFVFGFLALWLLHKPLDLSAKTLAGHPWQALGNGFLALATILLLIAAGLLLSVLVFVIGLGLNFIGLWQLSLALWVVAYACLALALAAAWFFMAYGTKIVVLYLVATWLPQRIFHRSDFWLNLLVLLADTIVYALLRSIPVAGWVINVLVTAAGFGAAWMAFRAGLRKPMGLPAAVPGEMTGGLPSPATKVKKRPAKAQ